MRVVFDNVDIPDGATPEQVDSWLRARVPDIQGWSVREADNQLVIDFGLSYEEVMLNKITAAETQFGVQMISLEVLNREYSREDINL